MNNTEFEQLIQKYYSKEIHPVTKQTEYVQKTKISVTMLHASTLERVYPDMRYSKPTGPRRLKTPHGIFETAGEAALALNTTKQSLCVRIYQSRIAEDHKYEWLYDEVENKPKDDNGSNE